MVGTPSPPRGQSLEQSSCSSAWGPPLTRLPHPPLRWGASVCLRPWLFWHRLREPSPALLIGTIIISSFSEQEAQTSRGTLPWAKAGPLMPDPGLLLPHCPGILCLQLAFPSGLQKSRLSLIHGFILLPRSHVSKPARGANE